MLTQIRPVALAILAGVLIAFFAQLGTNVRDVKRGFVENYEPRTPAGPDA